MHTTTFPSVGAFNKALSAAVENNHFKTTSHLLQQTSSPSMSFMTIAVFTYIPVKHVRFGQINMVLNKEG